MNMYTRNKVDAQHAGCTATAKQPECADPVTGRLQTMQQDVRSESFLLQRKLPLSSAHDVAPANARRRKDSPRRNS